MHAWPLDATPIPCLSRHIEAMQEPVGTARPLGMPRGIGFGIFLFIITLSIYGWYWAYKTQEEMKQHTGDGLGGVVGLVVWILLNAVTAFTIPSEIGNMYAQDGREKPMTGWTGLWLFPGAILIIPGIVWFVKVQGALNRYWESKGATA
jgi:hypothetical protein